MNRKCQRILQHTAILSALAGHADSIKVLFTTTCDALALLGTTYNAAAL